MGINFNETLIEIHIFSFEKFHPKKSSGKWRSFCLGLNVLLSRSQCVKSGCNPLFLPSLSDLNDFTGMAPSSFVSRMAGTSV